MLAEAVAEDDEDDEVEDDVAVLDLDDPLARHPVGLVHRPLPGSSPSARAFLRVLLENVPDDPSVEPAIAGAEPPPGAR